MANLTKLSFYPFLLFLLIPSLLLGQSKNDKTIVGKVGGVNVTYAELKENFSSGRTATPTIEELEDFLPTYLDYKAKLLAAKDEGYYQDSTLIKEHNSYVKQAAYAFWLQNEIKPALFQDYYERAQKELKTFHILIALNDNATEQEINDVISKLNMAKAEIQNGAPLEEVNRKYSTVRGNRSMGGDIPWISAGRTVREFEDVAYNLEVGEISEPFKTQFGYHIVLLQDKRETTPARLVKHIYIRSTGDSTAYDKIHEAYNYLEDGRTWNEVLLEYSEDAASASNNGRIGWVSYQSNFAMNFVDAVVSIDPAVPYTEPIQTNYGYHIFKIDSVQSYPTEEAERNAIMKEFEKSKIYEESNSFVVDFLIEKYDGKVYSDVLNKYRAWLTSNDSTEIASVTSSPSPQTIFEFNGNGYTTNDFHSYLKNNYGNRMALRYRDAWFDNFKEFVVDSDIIDLTLENYPEFNAQSENYLHGLVVYNINEENIWSAATVDSTRLMSMYQNNIQNYEYPERPFYYLIVARHDSSLNKAVEFINSGGSPDSLRSNIKRIQVAADSTIGFEQVSFEQLSEMETQSFSEIFKHNNNKAIIWLEDVLEPRTKTFEESFNQLLAEFQPQREEEWLNDLRNRYNVSADYKKLRKAYKKDS